MGSTACAAARNRSVCCRTRTSVATVSRHRPDTWDARWKITSSYAPGHSTGIRSPGMVPAVEARCTMRPYLKIVALIVGLVGAYLALLPLTV